MLGIDKGLVALGDSDWLHVSGMEVALTKGSTVHLYPFRASLSHRHCDWCIEGLHSFVCINRDPTGSHVSFNLQKREGPHSLSLVSTRPKKGAIVGEGG